MSFCAEVGDRFGSHILDGYTTHCSCLNAKCRFVQRSVIALVGMFWIDTLQNNRACGMSFSAEVGDRLGRHVLDGYTTITRA